MTFRLKSSDAKSTNATADTVDVLLWGVCSLNGCSWNDCVIGSFNNESNCHSFEINGHVVGIRITLRWHIRKSFKGWQDDKY